MKKIISFWLIVSLLLASLPMVSADDAANIAETTSAYSEKAAYFLQALGIPCENSVQKITKAEYIALLMQTGKLADGSLSTVEEYIHIAIEMGIHKNETGYLDPTLPISADEAIILAVRLLGYEEHVKSLGGDFYHYLYFAMQEELTKNLDCSDYSQLLTKSQACILLYNLLFAVGCDYIGPEFSVESSGEDLLTRLYQVSHGTGYVEAVNAAAVLGVTPPPQGYVVIDGVRCAFADGSAEALLGANVEYFLQYIQSELTAIALYPVNTMQDLELKGTDILAAKGFDSGDSAADRNRPYLQYDDGKKEKKIFLDGDTTFIYNGVQRFAVGNSDLCPVAGYVKIRENGDRKVVFINDYRYYIVGSVNHAEYSICDEYGNGEIILDPNANTVLTIDGKNVGFSNIVLGDLVAVRANYIEQQVDYDSPIFAEIIARSMSGTISAVDAAQQQVLIDETWYDVVPELMAQMQVGVSGTYKLGVMGEIVHLEENTASSGGTVAYVLDVQPPAGISEDIAVKLLCEDGEIRVLTVRGKVRFTGVDEKGRYVVDGNMKTERLANGILLENGQPVQQMIQYTTDDGDTIQSITTAEKRYLEPDYDGYDDTRFSMDFYGENVRVWNQIPTDTYLFNASTKLFIIPTGENVTDRDYSVGPYTVLGTDFITIPELSFYDCTSTFGVKYAVAKIEQSFNETPSADYLGSAPIAVVDRQVRALDENGEDVTKLYVYTQGRRVGLIPKDAELADSGKSAWGVQSKTKFTELSFGDIIQYRTNANGYVDMLQILHVYDPQNMDASRYVESSQDGFVSPSTTSYGRVERFVQSSYLMLSTSETRKFPLTVGQVYVCDLERQTISVENKDVYIRDARNGSNMDYAFIKTFRTTPKELVLYRQ